MNVTVTPRMSIDDGLLSILPTVLFSWGVAWGDEIIVAPMWLWFVLEIKFERHNP
jgi:hypothetical protein